MRLLLMLAAAIVAATGVGLSIAAAEARDQVVSTSSGGLEGAISSCPVSPTGIIGGSFFNRQSPMVVNSLGTVGSGRELAACVAWVNEATGRRTVSTPVFTYTDVSDEQPVYVVAGDSLWIYDVATTRGPELLHISDTTHKVLRTLTMPALIRPTIAADADGFWIGVGPDGGGTRSVLYFVSQGASQPRVVLSGSRYLGIDRICLAGASAWLSLQVASGSTIGSTGYRIDRPGDAPRSETVDPFQDCPVEYQTFGSPVN